MTIYSGDFGYEVDAYGRTVTLVAYNGTDTEVIVPQTFGKYPVASIAKSAFSGNSVVESILIPASVTTIEHEAFQNCSALETINIPETVTSLGKGVCIDCTSLVSATVDIPANKLPDNTFAGCTSLSTVVLSDSITEIGTTAFAKCTSLTDLSFLNNVTTIGDSQFFRNGFTDIVIPGNITSIPYYAFAYSQTLHNVTIPSTVTYIHPDAFEGSDNTVINCYYGSYAYNYAITYGIDYLLLDGVKLGDVTGDGRVMIDDATAIQRHLASLEILEGVYLKAADTNQDGTVTISDATTLQMFIAEYSIPYPLGEIMTQ